MKIKIAKIGAIMIFAIAFIGGVAHVINQFHLHSIGVETYATVLSITRTYRNSRGMYGGNGDFHMHEMQNQQTPVYTARIEFYYGAVHTVSTTVNRTTSIGDEIRILFDPQNPQNFTTDMSPPIVNLVLVIFLLLFLIAAYIVIFHVIVKIVAKKIAKPPLSPGN